MAIKHEAIIKRANLYQVDPRQIKIEEGHNPRESFGGEDDDALKESIIALGVRVPLQVWKSKSGQLFVIDGERRLRATMQAVSEGHEIKAIPCTIVSKVSQEERLINALVANEGKPLSPAEIGKAYNKFISWGYTAKDIATKFGVSVPLVYKRLKLAEASPEVQEALSSKQITQQQVIEIVTDTETVEEQSEALKETKAKRDKPKVTRPMPPKSIRRMKDSMADLNTDMDFIAGFMCAVNTILKDTDIDMEAIALASSQDDPVEYLKSLYVN